MAQQLLTTNAGALSLKALRAVYRAELGIDPPTILTRRVLTAFAASSVEEVLHLLTMRDRPRLETRRQLVHPMFDAADAGDAAARQIVVSQGEALGDYVIVAARKVGLLETPFTLVLTGGVLRHPSPLLRKALVGRVQEVCPSVRAIQSRFEPAAGAVFLALDLGCIETGASLMERLAATLPGASFFSRHDSNERICVSTLLTLAFSNPSWLCRMSRLRLNTLFKNLNAECLDPHSSGIAMAIAPRRAVS